MDEIVNNVSRTLDGPRTAQSDHTLFNALRDFSVQIARQARETDELLTSIDEETNDVNVAFHNSLNRFLLLGNSQFMENRVWVEQEESSQNAKTLSSENPAQLNLEAESQDPQELSDLLRSCGRDALQRNPAYVRGLLGKDAASGEQLAAERKANRFERPMPYIIGSVKFATKPSVGLVYEDEEQRHTHHGLVGEGVDGRSAQTKVHETNDVHLDSVVPQNMFEEQTSATQADIFAPTAPVTTSEENDLFSAPIHIQSESKTEFEGPSPQIAEKGHERCSPPLSTSSSHIRKASQAGHGAEYLPSTTQVDFNESDVADNSEAQQKSEGIRSALESAFARDTQYDDTTQTPNFEGPTSNVDFRSDDHIHSSSPGSQQKEDSNSSRNAHAHNRQAIDSLFGGSSLGFGSSWFGDSDDIQALVQEANFVAESAHNRTPTSELPTAKAETSPAFKEHNNDHAADQSVATVGSTLLNGTTDKNSTTNSRALVLADESSEDDSKLPTQQKSGGLAHTAFFVSESDSDDKSPSVPVKSTHRNAIAIFDSDSDEDSDSIIHRQDRGRSGSGSRTKSKSTIPKRIGFFDDEDEDDTPLVNTKSYGSTPMTAEFTNTQSQVQRSGGSADMSTVSITSHDAPLASSTEHSGKVDCKTPASISPVATVPAHATTLVSKGIVLERSSTVNSVSSLSKHGAHVNDQSVSDPYEASKTKISSIVSSDDDSVPPPAPVHIDTTDAQYKLDSKAQRVSNDTENVIHASSSGTLATAAHTENADGSSSRAAFSMHFKYDSTDEEDDGPPPAPVDKPIVHQTNRIPAIFASSNSDDEGDDAAPPPVPVHLIQPEDETTVQSDSAQQGSVAAAAAALFKSGFDAKKQFAPPAPRSTQPASSAAGTHLASAQMTDPAIKFENGDVGGAVQHVSRAHGPPKRGKSRRSRQQRGKDTSKSGHTDQNSISVSSDIDHKSANDTHADLKSNRVDVTSTSTAVGGQNADAIAALFDMPAESATSSNRKFGNLFDD